MSSNTKDLVTISCEAYIKNDDGSWASVRTTDIQTPDRTIRIPPEMLFYKDKPMWGIDIVRILDENCLQ